jgi:hypothetical protein
MWQSKVNHVSRNGNSVGGSLNMSKHHRPNAPHHLKFRPLATKSLDHLENKMASLIMQGSKYIGAGVGVDTTPTFLGIGCGINFNNNVHSAKKVKAAGKKVHKKGMYYGGGELDHDDDGNGLFFSGVPVSAQNGSGSGSKKIVRMNLSTSDALKQAGKGLSFY